MGWFAFFISALILSFSILINRFLKNKVSINPAIFFNSLWTFILFLSALNLYNITKPSDTAYGLILLMQACFTFGYFIAATKKNNASTQTKADEATLKKCTDNFLSGWRLKLFYALCILNIIFNIIDIILVLQYISQGVPAWQVRNWTLEPYGSSNPILDRRSFIETIFRNIILGAFGTLIAPTSAYVLLKTKSKHRFRIFILAILGLLTSSLAGGGGRIGYITFIGAFLLVLFINRKDEHIQKILKKYKITIICSIIAAITMIVFFTIIRTGFGNVFKQIYTYFALPPTLLDSWLPTIAETPNTFGLLTFYGFFGYPLRLLGMLGLPTPALFATATTSMLNAEKFVNVGYGVANAFVSPVYYFMIDGGIPFLILSSIFFGFIVTMWIKKSYKQNNLKNTAILYLIMYGIFISFMRVQTVIPTFVISFIMAIIFLNNKEKKIDEQQHKD